MAAAQPLVQCLRSLLPGTSPWSELSPTQTSALLQNASLNGLARHERSHARLAIVIRGVLATKRELIDGRPVLCALYPPGTMIDRRSQLRCSEEELVSLAESQIIILSQQHLEDCCERYPEVGKEFFSLARDSMAMQEHHAADLVSKTPLEKLASILLEFASWPRMRAPTCSRNRIALPIARSDIAQYMGLKPETVSRAIKRLEAEGVITSCGRNCFAITRSAAVREIALGGRPRQHPSRA